MLPASASESPTFEYWQGPETGEESHLQFQGFWLRMILQMREGGFGDLHPEPLFLDTTLSARLENPSYCNLITSSLYPNVMWPNSCTLDLSVYL
jgi:hypothetical protein